MMRPPTRSNRSNTESEMSEYNAKLLGKEEEKYAEMSENMGQFLSQRKRTISIGANLIPVQNVIRICALSIAVSVGYALNCISVITSMNNVVNHEPGENSLELWAILYVSSCFCLFILCFVLVLVSFIGIKFQIFLKLILYAFILGVGTQIFSLIIGFSFQNTHNYICYQFELLYPLLGLYIIFLIFFFESSNKYVRIFQIIAFSFVLFITPSLQLALNASIMPKSYLFACIAVMCAFILMLTHICCFLSHYNSGLFFKFIIVSLLVYTLYVRVLHGGELFFDKYEDKYRIYYYYVLLTILYIIYICEMFIKVPPKIVTTSIEYLQERESFNTAIEKYEGTLKCSMSGKTKKSTAYSIQSLLGIVTTDNESMARFHGKTPYFKSINPNEKIESVVKIFPDFRPCFENKDKYFAEFKIGDMNNEKEAERFKDSITAIVPFYNEDASEIYATLQSLHSNFAYLKKTQTKYNFTHFNVCLVSDGWFKSDISTKKYLSKLYNCDMTETFKNYNFKEAKHNTVILQSKGNQKLCINPFNNEDNKLFLKVTTIIKIDNRKKANSHEWFIGKYGFAEWCQCDYMYFTDAYSTLNPRGLYQMVMHMNDSKNQDVVCCTGRARVYNIGQESHFKYLTREEPTEPLVAGEHSRPDRSNKWWKHEIFKMDDDDQSISSFGNIVYNIQDSGGDQNRLFSINAHLRCCQMFEFEALYGTIGCYLLGGFMPVIPGPCGFYRSKYMLRDKVRGWYFDKINEKNDPDNVNLVFGNMKLAEDRILTIASILNCDESVRHSLIPDCVFYFDPQPSLTQLMKQRRRWLNGSIATIIFVLRKVAFSEWKVNCIRRQYTILVWYMQLLMYMVLFISPPLLFVISFHFGLSTILRGFTHMPKHKITSIVILCEVISWTIYLFFVFYAQKSNKPSSNKCKIPNCKNKSKYIMLITSYSFGILTIVGSIMQATDLVKLVVQDPKSIFTGELNEFNFFVMTIEVVFFVQSFILAPIFSKDSKTLYILLKTAFYYFLYSPFYVVFFFINAIANIHDLSWGTRPDDAHENDNTTKHNPKHTTYKILACLLFFNIVVAIVIYPLTQSFVGRMIFFGLMALPVVFTIFFSLIWLIKDNLVGLLRLCPPKRVDDQFEYVYTKNKNNNISINDTYQIMLNDSTTNLSTIN